MLRAESADEEALLSGGMKLGWELLLRTKDSVIIREGYPSSPDEAGAENGVHKFELLEELPFSSSRQRMTILVRDTWNNKICLYSKGADSKMLSLSCDEEEMAKCCVPRSADRCSPDHGSLPRRSSFMATPIEDDEDEVELERHGLLMKIANFSQVGAERAGDAQMRSKQGYRLLLVGGKYVLESELEAWERELDKAKKSMKHREEVRQRRCADSQNIEKAFVGIERDLSILGATAVEDELQDCILEDIQRLREAGITVAMATGRLRGGRCAQATRRRRR